MIATLCLLVNLPDSITTCPCSVSQTSLLGRHVSEIRTMSHFAPCTAQSNSSNLSLELIDLAFFCRTVSAIFSGLVSFSFRGEVLAAAPFSCHFFTDPCSCFSLLPSVFVVFIRDLFRLLLLFVWRCADAAAASDVVFFLLPFFPFLLFLFLSDYS